MSKHICIIAIELKNDNDRDIIEVANQIASRYNLDIKIFTTNCSVPTKTPKRLTILPIHEAKYYTGIAIVWDLMTLELCANFCNLHKILFYQGDVLPWTTFRQNQSFFWENFYDNDKIQVFTCNSDIHKILSLTWREPRLIENISPKNIGDLINEI